MDSGSRLPRWSDSDYETYKANAKKLFGLSCQFFNAITDENIIAIFNTMDELSGEAFWELFELCKCYERISENKFSELMQNCSTSIYFILGHKAIVSKYDTCLKAFLLGKVDYARIFVHVYEQLFNNSIKKLFLPSSITSDDINVLLEAYIDSEQSGFHALETISQMQQKENFKVR